MKFHLATFFLSSAIADDMHMSSGDAYAEVVKILNLKRFIHDWLDTDQATASATCKANSNAFMDQCADKGESWCRRYECDGGEFLVLNGREVVRTQRPEKEVFTPLF